VGKLRLLVDTGASYTILPVEVIEKLGYDTHHPLRQVQMTSANGIVVAPLVKVSWFNCLGQLLKNFPIVAHTIPVASFDGVLGMDFLIRRRAVIAVAEAEIRCQQSKVKRP
jgi:aspartyl protease family protein